LRLELGRVIALAGLHRLFKLLARGLLAVLRIDLGLDAADFFRRALGSLRFLSHVACPRKMRPRGQSPPSAFVTAASARAAPGPSSDDVRGLEASLSRNP